MRTHIHARSGNLTQQRIQHAGLIQGRRARLRRSLGVEFLLPLQTEIADRDLCDEPGAARKRIKARVLGR